VDAFETTGLPGIPETKKMSDTFDASNHVVETFSQHWDAPLLVESQQERRWQYGDVLKRAIAVDEWLVANGFDRGAPIRIAPTNSSIPLTFYLGALLSDRLVYVIDPSRGKQDIDEMLDIADGDRLLTDDTSLINRDGAVGLRPVEPREVAKSDALNKLSNVDTSGPFLVTFTSGTTGTPKGVLHSFDNLVRASLRFGDRFDFSTEDTFYHTLPMGYMAGILNALLLPMCHGSTVVVGKRTSATTVAEFFEPAEEAGVNVFWLTPTILRMLLQFYAGPYDGVDSAIGCVATEPLPTQLQREFESEFDISLYETYGLSETLFITTEFPDQRGGRDGVGPTLPDVDLDIAADGEILIDTPWLFLDYVNRDGSIDTGHTYHTGDIGETRNGTVYVTGRKKDIIVRNGINVSPSRIEEVLSTFDSVSEVEVFGYDHDGVGEQVIAVVELEGEDIEDRVLERRIISELGSDHRPDEILDVDEVPEAGGKYTYSDTIERLRRDEC
jgi:long-chain acyl-CoA synthetase